LAFVHDVLDEAIGLGHLLAERRDILLVELRDEFTDLLAESFETVSRVSDELFQLAFEFALSSVLLLRQFECHDSPPSIDCDSGLGRFFRRVNC
jgi:hypothetical protein